MTITSASAPRRAYAHGNLTRVILIAGVLPVLLGVVGTALMLVWSPLLPHPIAIHWGASGRADGYGSLASMISVLLGCVLTFSAAVTLALAKMRAVPHPSYQARVLAATSVWLSGFLTVGITGSVAAQRGLADAASACPVSVILLLGAVVGVVLGVGAWFLTPPPGISEPEDDDAHSALALAPQERALWSRAVRPATRTVVLFFAIVGLGVLGGLVFFALTTAPSMWWMVVLVSLILVASAVCFSWRISIDDRGVSVRSGAGYPRVDIPLSTISTARVVQVNPFGGWGLRWAAGRTGIVVRAGEAVEITRISGRSLVVTVDDAATAVALLEGLLHRRGSSMPSSTA
jgi:hypothetical protein